MKGLLSLRILVAMGLVALAMRPTMIRPEPGAPSEWAVFLDASPSMKVVDPVQRFKQAVSIIPDILKAIPASQLFLFSDKATPIKPDELAQATIIGSRTEMAKSLQQVFADKKYRGVVLVSDGRAVGEGDAVSMASSLGVPFLTIGVGDRSLYKDVMVKSVQTSPFAFKNIPTTLSAGISMVGYGQRKITVRLKENDRVLSLQTIESRTDETETTVTFSWTPDSLGSRVLVIEADTFPGEVSVLNNRKEVRVDVGRDRFRVLYLSGDPGPEYGYLRHQFKSDPGVELVTFVILRNNSNNLTIPDAELSLIPFPTQDVLLSQMATFDLVVFEQFQFWQYGLSPGILDAIKRRVEQGGSFLIMGDGVVFGPGSGYHISPANVMIPVELGPGMDQRKVTAPVVVNALNHPIFRIDQNAGRNAEIWSNLPALEDVALLPGVKPGAAVLASVAVDGKNYPVLTVWKFGKGRVAALTARTTWMWSLLDGKKGHDLTVYSQFWKNMVVWLTRSSDYKSVRVGLDGNDLKLNQPNTVRVWVYDDYFKPLSDAQVKVQVTRPDGSNETLELSLETAGVYSASMKAEATGSYKIQSWVSRHGRRYGDDTLSIRVIDRQLEQEDLRPDFSLLKEVAHISGGRFLPINDFQPELLTEFQKDASAKIGKKVLVWNSPWLLAVLALLVAAEWAIRRWRGLP